jgi:molybdenum cofactor biosynthesis enzyme MoaA
MYNYYKHFSFYEHEYYSCPWIEAGLTFGPQSLTCCCISHHGNRGWPLLVPNFLGEVIPLDEVIAAKQKLIISNQQPDHDPACRGCSFLKKRNWKPRKYLFDRLNFSHFYKCNLKCVYCYTTQPGYAHFNEIKLLPSLSMMIKESILDPHSMIIWGGGEPTILSEFDSIFSLLGNYGVCQTLNTNGTILSEAILKWLPLGRFKIVISIDAGTAETYQKIKGVNAFEKVWAHTKQYAAAGKQRVFVKYIFLNINCGEINLFVDQIDKANINMVFADFEGSYTKIPTEIIEAAGLLSFELRRRGVWFGTMGVGANAHPEQMWSHKVTEAHHRISREKPFALSEWTGLGKQMYHSMASLIRSGYDPATIRQNILSTLSNVFR